MDAQRLSRVAVASSWTARREKSEIRDSSHVERDAPRYCLVPVLALQRASLPVTRRR